MRHPMGVPKIIDRLPAPLEETGVLTYMRLARNAAHVTLASVAFVALGCAAGTPATAAAVLAGSDTTVIGYDGEKNPNYSGAPERDPEEPADLPTDPSEPDRTVESVKPNAERCDPGDSLTTTNLANDFKADFTDGVVNAKPNKATLKVTADVSTTFRWHVSIEVSKEFDTKLFGKITGTVNGGVEREKTTTKGSTIEVEVDGNDSVKVDRGVWREQFSFKEYRITSDCRETTTYGRG